MALLGIRLVCDSLLNPNLDVQAPHDWDGAKGKLGDLAQCQECHLAISGMVERSPYSRSRGDKLIKDPILHASCMRQCLLRSQLHVQVPSV